MPRINSEIAYIFGALRDATLDIRKGKNYEIKIAQKEHSWLFFFKNYSLRILESKEK